MFKNTQSGQILHQMSDNTGLLRFWLIAILLVVLSLCWPNEVLATRLQNAEGSKEAGTQADIDSFINYLDRKTQEYLSQGLSIQQARKKSFIDWSADHHGTDRSAGRLFGTVKNTELPSNLGVVDMDWLAVLGHTKSTRLFGAPTYVGGKLWWFMKRAFEQKPDLSTFLNAFPDTNWRALAVHDLLMSGKVDPREIFDPSFSSKHVNKKRKTLNRFFTVWQNVGMSAGNGFDKFKGKNEWTGFPMNGVFLNVKLPNSYTLEKTFGRATGRVFAPKPVGGIDLSQAGSIKGIDEITGFRVDPQHRTLSIIGKTNRNWNLPNLRLGDIAVIFRAVYQGHSPTITIDPDPSNPEGPLKLVIPSRYISSSYAHFILYHSDRIMKSYSVLHDNLTGERIDSSIDGYSLVEEAVFDSFADEAAVCERFWIVPDLLREFRPAESHTSLFEFPLKVETRRCKINSEGKLEDLVGAQTTRGAAMFSTWFTDNMSAIGEEAAYPLPAQMGPGKVNVFAELRRIAGLTAIAERMRDTGNPLPHWAQEEPSFDVPVHAKTPALTVKKTARTQSGTQTITVHGGADLGFSRRPHQHISKPGILRLERERTTQTRLEESKSLDEELEQLTLLSPVSVKNIKTANTRYTVLQISGRSSLVVGDTDFPAHDLDIPLEILPIRFGRKYNRIAKTGPWGPGWEMDLPQLSVSMAAGELERNTRALHRDYALRWEDYQVYFDRLSDIAEIGTNGYRARNSDTVKWLVQGKSPMLSQPTRQVHMESGQILHFDESRQFVAYEQNREMVIYERGPNGFITAVKGTVGRQIKHAFNFSYRDKQLTGIRSSTETSGTVIYDYTDDGKLASVTKDGASIDYEYQNTSIVSISLNVPNEPTQTTQFEYDDLGLLKRVTDFDGSRFTRRMSVSSGKVTVWFDDESDPELSFSVVYGENLQAETIVFAEQT